MHNLFTPHRLHNERGRRTIRLVKCRIRQNNFWIRRLNRRICQLQWRIQQLHCSMRQSNIRIRQLNRRIRLMNFSIRQLNC